MNVSEGQSFTHGTPRAERIAQLNDQLRKTGSGGRIMVTAGVRQLEGYTAAAVLLAIRQFDSFDVDNDPHGERDFGDVDFCGAELLWKIDYYDNELVWASPDPADPQVTTRVLTIMMAGEY